MSHHIMYKPNVTYEVVIIILITILCLLISQGCGKHPDINDLPELITTVQNKENDSIIRMKAAIEIAKLGDKAKDAVPYLINSLDDNDRRVRECVLAALGGIGPDAIAAVPYIVDMLNDSDMVGPAAEAIECIKPEPRIVVPDLIDALDADYDIFRVDVIHALKSYGNDALEAIPKLEIMSKTDSSSYVREEAELAIKEIKRS